MLPPFEDQTADLAVMNSFEEAEGRKEGRGVCSGRENRMKVLNMEGIQLVWGPLRQ